VLTKRPISIYKRDLVEYSKYPSFRAAFVYFRISVRNKKMTHHKFCISNAQDQPHDATELAKKTTTYLKLFLAECLSSFCIDFQQVSVALTKTGAWNGSVATFQSLQNSIVDKYVLFL